MKRIALGPVRSFCASQAVMDFLAFILGKNADLVLLTLLVASAEEVSYYNVSAALAVGLSTLLISGAGGIGLSATSMMVQKDDPGLLHRAWRFRIKTSSLLAVPPMVLAFGIAPTLVPTLLSNSYRPAAAVLRVVLIGQTIISLLGGGAHADILLASGRHKLVRSMRITAGVGNVGLDLLLIPFWGAMGAVIATAFTGVGLVIAEWLALRRLHLANRLPGRSQAVIFGASLIAGLSVWWLPLSAWSYLAVCGFGFLTVLALLVVIAKPYDVEDAQILRRAGPPLDRMVRFLGRTA